MKIKPLTLQGCYEIVLEPHEDERGYFMRTYDRAIFAEHGLITEWVQENQSMSNRKGLIRGLHFQKPPYTETKWVRVLVGIIWDVFVDLRKDSATYGRWETLELSENKHNSVYIPKGFAHGFCALTDRAIVAYKVDASYRPEAEGGLRWDDEMLNISWPVQKPFLSKKDLCLELFKNFYSPF